MKSRMRQDDRVLEAEKGKPRCQPGDPCPICGRPRTLGTPSSRAAFTVTWRAALGLPRLKCAHSYWRLYCLPPQLLCWPLLLTPT
ncbi:unnamed protein product [Merluccius merluccius]